MAIVPHEPTCLCTKLAIEPEAIAPTYKTTAATELSVATELLKGLATDPSLHTKQKGCKPCLRTIGPGQDVKLPPGL